MRKIQVLAVDFDGTICHSVYPDATDINLTAIDVLKRFRNHGGEIILWTCRKGQALDNAVKACLNAGLEFDAVNAEAANFFAAAALRTATGSGIRTVSIKSHGKVLLFSNIRMVNLRCHQSRRNRPRCRQKSWQVRQQHEVLRLWAPRNNRLRNHCRIFHR